MTTNEIDGELSIRTMSYSERRLVFFKQAENIDSRPTALTSVRSAPMKSSVHGTMSRPASARPSNQMIEAKLVTDAVVEGLRPLLIFLRSDKAACQILLGVEVDHENLLARPSECRAQIHR